jgi:hypothetical protein
MVRPIEVRPAGRYRIWLRYQDGTEGEVDLSHLAGTGCSPRGTRETCSPRSISVRTVKSNGRAASIA